MQLTGYKMGNGYYIQITVICFNPNIYNPIAFRIDTGCDITVISLNDAINIKLDFSKLGQPFNSLGISGLVPTYNIFDCGFAFNLGECYITEKLNLISVSRPLVTEENKEIIKNIPSLLGMDFLQRYTIRFNDHYIFLEK